MFFIEFTYDFCKRIVLEFFYGFSNDFFHEINITNCYDDADLHGGGAAAGREHRRQDH